MNNDKKVYIIAFAVLLFLVINIVGNNYYSDLMYTQYLDLTFTQKIPYILWKFTNIIAYSSVSLFVTFQLIIAIKDEAKQS